MGREPGRRSWQHIFCEVAGVEGVAGSVYQLFSLSVGKIPPFFSKGGKKGMDFLMVSEIGDVP